MCVQLEALAGRDEDSGSDGESWGDELEKELAGEEEDAVQSVRPFVLVA